MEDFLGYLFWHWPLPDVSTESYEEGLRSFQRALTSDGPSGLIEALTFREERLPWETRRGRRYEDWYVVKDFSGLGVINQAAVKNSAAAPHDSVARQASGGAGGVYRRILGELPPRDARFAAWFQKPSGLTYRSLYERVGGSVKHSETGVWQRQMTLGPAPEFCVHSRERVRLPTTFRSVSVEMRVVSHG